MRSATRITVIGGIWLMLLSFAVAGCGEVELDPTDSASQALLPYDSARLVRPRLRDRVFPGEIDRVVQPDDAAVSADDSDVDFHRIEMRMRVRAVGDRLALDIDAYNPADCHWFGHLFFEHELGPSADAVSPQPRVRTLARYYRVRIPSGAHVRGTLYVPRPAQPGPHIFIARAYHPDGGDREPFFNCLLSEADGTESACPIGEDGDETAPELVLDEGVTGVLDETDPADTDVADPGFCAEHTPPIFADLRLRFELDRILAHTRWLNRFSTPWWGDLYVDMVTPELKVQIMRRDLGIRVPPDHGFATVDGIQRPERPGLYWFNARALRRDGSAEVRWIDPGTTEITAVCNGFVCELIRPEQQRANLTLRGDSAIHLESDFFGESVRVTMATDDAEWDITDLCRIRQDPDPSGEVGNHIGVTFDTRRLPVGPDTMARYTIELFPMPVVPEGAKRFDSLWIRTDGGWCPSCDAVAAD